MRAPFHVALAGLLTLIGWASEAQTPTPSPTPKGPPPLRLAFSSLIAEAAFEVSGSRDFAAGERGWFAYMDGLCTARASKYEGGTAQPIEFGACEEGISTAHLKALAATLRLLTQH